MLIPLGRHSWFDYLRKLNFTHFLAVQKPTLGHSTVCYSDVIFFCSTNTDYNSHLWDGCQTSYTTFLKYVFPGKLWGKLFGDGLSTIFWLSQQILLEHFPNKTPAFTLVVKNILEDHGSHKSFRVVSFTKENCMNVIDSLVINCNPLNTPISKFWSLRATGMVTAVWWAMLTT